MIKLAAVFLALYAALLKITSADSISEKCKPFTCTKDDTEEVYKVFQLCVETGKCGSYSDEKEPNCITCKYENMANANSELIICLHESHNAIDERTYLTFMRDFSVHCQKYIPEVACEYIMGNKTICLAAKKL
ncbi:hypothetical protein CHUAL_001969 [Chamberlinius hualienensis]